MNNKNKKHLWEVNHPYYCEKSNYFGYGEGTTSDDVNDKFKSWDEFLSEYKNTDKDMNLVFRWDWEAIKTVDDDYTKPVWSKDWNYRDGRLTIFWMMQRKGFHRATTIEVCKNDETNIIEWLQPRFEHLLKLWSPLKVASDKRVLTT